MKRREREENSRDRRSDIRGGRKNERKNRDQRGRDSRLSREKRQSDEKPRQQRFMKDVHCIMNSCSTQCCNLLYDYIV